MGDGVKGTVTPLGSLFSHEEARKAARRVEEAVVQRSSELRRLQGFVSENSALISLVRSLPDELSHEIMVPFGGSAFFPGRLIHTNEFLVLLGEGYYVDRTAKQTTDILLRRGKALEAQVEALKAMVLDLEAEAKFFNSTAEEAFEGLMEIREEYVEEPAKNSLNSDNSLHSFKTQNLQKLDEDEDEEYARIMARIEELEREEELENGNISKDNTQENEDTVVHDGDGGSKDADEDEDIEAGHSFSTSDHKYEVIETKQKPKDPSQKASDQKVLSSFISHQTGNIPKQQLKEEALSNSSMQFPVEARISQQLFVPETTFSQAYSFSNKELSVGKEKTASSPFDAQLSVSKMEDSSHETTRQTFNPVSSGLKAFSGYIVDRDIGPQPIQSSKSTNLSQAFTGSVVERDIGPQPILSSKSTNLSQSSAPSSTKPVSRFKMQKGNR